MLASERHELNVFSLMAGLAFLVLGVGRLLAEATDLSFDAAWVVPVLLVGLGLAGLLGTVLSGRDASTERGMADGGDDEQG